MKLYGNAHGGFRPVGRMLVKLLPEARETKGGLALPDEVVLLSFREAHVIMDDTSLSLPAGAIVLFRRAHGMVVPFDDQPDDCFMLLEDVDVLGGSW